MDFNPTKIEIEKLLNLKKKRMKIQEFVMKILNLVHQAKLESQTIKALMFRGLQANDQNKIMMINSENEFRTETVEQFLKRIMRLFWREKIRKREEKESNFRNGNIDHAVFIWNQKEDLMDLNQINAEKRKYFKYEKTEYIRHFCKSKEKNLITVESENEKILDQKEDQRTDKSL